MLWSHKYCLCIQEKFRLRKRGTQYSKSNPPHNRGKSSQVFCWILVDLQRCPKQQSSFEQLERVSFSILFDVEKVQQFFTQCRHVLDSIRYFYFWTTKLILTVHTFIRVMERTFSKKLKPDSSSMNIWSWNLIFKARVCTISFPWRIQNC